MRVRAIFCACIAVLFGTAAPVGAQEPNVPGPPVMAILAQQYLPSGTVTTFRATDAVVLWTLEVRRGDVIVVVNLEPLIPSFQHSVTACVSPCRTLPPLALPAESGAFDTGMIPLAGGQKSIDTSPLAPGTYEFFCKPHPWMRGAFAVA